MSTNATNAASQQDAADKKPAQKDTVVTKTVQTVEVRSSAGQPNEEGVVQPVKVVHEIPAKEAAKDDNSGAGVKQD